MNARHVHVASVVLAGIAILADPMTRPVDASPPLALRSWYEPFDPAEWYGFVEGNAWTYTWYVSHDIEGLIDLMGGADAFTEKLTYAFEQEKPHKFGRGHKGHFAYGNQSSCGMAHLFNHAGKPWLSQYWVRQVNDLAFAGTTPFDGYCDEEDQGNQACNRR